jgi:hypothetical protein
LLGLLEASDKLKEVLNLRHDISFEGAITLPETFSDILVFYHEVLKVCHLFILSLKVTLE